MIVLRPYNTAGSVTFTLRQAGSDAFATSSHWTPAAGDVKLSLDGGTQANSTNLPTFANGQWTLSLTAAELQAARVRVNIDDGDIVPESVLIETYGHASAAYPTAYADQWLGIASKITTDHGAGSYVDTGAGLDASGVRTAVGLASANLDTQLAAIPTVAPLDATATEAAALAAVNSYAPAKAGDAMALTTGERAAVRSDLLTKTQFDAALPGNFGVLSIDTSGNVTTTGGGGALTPTQATWLEETHAKAMLIGSPGAFAYRKIPVITANAIEVLVAGDDYAASMNRSLQWARPTSLFGDFTGATATFRAVCIDGDSATIGPVAGAVKDEGTEAQSVEFELSKTDTAVHEGAYAWTVVVTKTDQTLTVARGNTRVVGGLT